MKYVEEIDNSLEDLIPGFLNNRINDLTNFKNLLQVGNFGQIAFDAHGFKGTLGSYGFMKGQEFGIELEKSAFNQNGVEVSSILNQLEKYFSNLEIIYIEDKE